MPRSQELAYRPDIDGLRAVAVLAVVGFHYGVPGFGGGYVGVDVFFVISGYLITRLILRGLEDGAFSLRHFYERRVRRIFPALFLVLAATYGLGVLVLLPADLRSLAESALATLGFASNVLFWTQTGYFDDPAGMKPLLHTWSLAVEEQFYIVFPPLVLLVFRWGRSHLPLVLAGLGVASFLLSVYQVGAAEETAFFLPFGRAWELLVGAWLVVSPWREREWSMARAAAGWLGIAAIALPVLLYDAGNDFPGHGALPPVLGAAALIWSGERGHVVNRGLGLWPFVAIGLVSYALYLWHWPLIVFARLYLVVPITPLQTFAVFAVALLLSVASWRLLEQPVRRGRGAAAAFAGAAAGATTLAAVGGLALGTGGFPGRVPAEAAGFAAASATARESACFGPLPRQSCVLGPADGVPVFALWGDSHARALVPGFGALAERLDVTGIAFGAGGCPPVVGVGVGRDWRKCADLTGRQLAFLIDAPELRTVFIAARWALYVEGTNYTPEPDFEFRLAAENRPAKGIGHNALLLRQGLEVAVARLSEAGKRVVLVGPVPEVGYDVPRTLGAVRFLGRDVAIAPSRADYEARQARSLDLLRSLAEERANVRLVLPSGVLCDAQVCRVVDGAEPLYFDDDHLSPAGARRVTGALHDDLAGQIRAPSPAASETPARGVGMPDIRG